MKHLLNNICQAQASTIAGGLVAAIGVFTAADIELSKEVIVAMSAVAAFLAVFDGPNKPPPGRLPIIIVTLLWVATAVTGLTSCTATWDRDSWWPQVTIDSEQAAEWVNDKLGGKDRVEIKGNK